MFEDISDWLEDLQRDKFFFSNYKWGETFPILNLILTILSIFAILSFAIIVSPFLIIMYLIKGICNFKRQIIEFKSFVKSLIPVNIGKIIDNYEKELLKDANYYHLDKYVLNRELDLKTFIKNFVREYSKQHTTYHDMKFICDRNRRRSLGDIFLICRCYFPTCTLKEVLGYLIELLEDSKIYGSYCRTINKYVFHYQTTSYYTNQDVEYDDNLEFIDFVKYYEKLKK